MTSTNNTAETTGNKVGSGLKGVFGVINGVGETIRGGINSAVDGAGDAVANRNSGTVTSNSPHGDSNQVFVKGQQEVKEGIAQVQGSSSQSQTKY
ncbi:hypothetical protein BDY24DRAFT_413486 [Mrakia frigida]|uniref:uncharacterized protein n=1 Tax=Mrakia frigida TaxID=29902 RepID=UPI003FCBFC31